MDQNLKELIQKATCNGFISDEHKIYIYEKSAEMGINKTEVDIYIQSYLNQNSIKEEKDIKKYAAIAYITIIGFLIAFIKNKEHKSSLVSYHIKQVIGFIILNLAATVIILILFIPSIFVGFNSEYLGFIYIISFVIWGVILYSIIISFINAIKELEKPAPIFGVLFKKIYNKETIDYNEKLNNLKNTFFTKDFMISLIEPIYLIFCLGTWLFLLQVKNSDQKMLFVLFLILTISGFILKNKIKIHKLYLVLFLILLIYSALISFDIFREISGDSYYELSGIKNELKEDNNGYYCKLFGNVTHESTKDMASILGYILILCELLAVVLIIYKLTQLIQKFIQPEYLIKTNNFLENNNKKIIYVLIIFLTLNISASIFFAFKNKTDIQNQIILLKQKISEKEKIKKQANSNQSSVTDENNQDASIIKNGENILIARFISYDEGDLVYYNFEDENGKIYYFSSLPDDYKLIDENQNVNPLFYKKKFRIKWKAIPDSGGEDSYPYNEIITIELIE